MCAPKSLPKRWQNVFFLIMRVIKSPSIAFNQEYSRVHVLMYTKKLRNLLAFFYLGLEFGSCQVIFVDLDLKDLYTCPLAES